MYNVSWLCFKIVDLLKCNPLPCFSFLFVDEPTTTPCKQGEFQCGDFDQCIPESKVCDGNPNDCPNNEDEPMSCGEYNMDCRQNSASLLCIATYLIRIFFD